MHMLHLFTSVLLHNPQLACSQLVVFLHIFIYSRIPTSNFPLFLTFVFLAVCPAYFHLSLVTFYIISLILVHACIHLLSISSLRVMSKIFISIAFSNLLMLMLTKKSNL